MGIEALATVADLKTWLDITSTDANRDAMLQRLVYAATRSILSYISHDTIRYTSHTVTANGTGTVNMVLPDWPVWSITSLVVDGVTVPAATGAPYSNGYVLENAAPIPPSQPQQLTLYGYRFNMGGNNVQVTYKAGFAVLGEAQVVATAAAQANLPYGPFAQDEGVTYANGTPLTKVASSPSVGQYTVNTTGGYTFNAADNGQTVLLSYSYVPQDLNQVCIELAAERYKYKGRIGEMSRGLGGQETASYRDTDLTPYLKMVLNPYRKVFQPC